MMLDSGWAAAKFFAPDYHDFNLSFNHISNVFVVKKMRKYFIETGRSTYYVNKKWIKKTRYS
jgi:hypothetical protein